MSAEAKIDAYNLRSRTIQKFDIRPLNSGISRRSTTKRCGTSGGRRKPFCKQNKRKPKRGEKSQWKTGGKCPPPMEFDEEEYMEQCRDAAEPALDHYNNHIAPDDDGVTYEMVDLGISNAFGIPMQPGYKLHSNFIAKPHYSSSVGGDSAPHMLFFAEVWKAIYPDPTFAVLKCQRLGPDGHVSTGRNGCRACPESDDPLHHPLEGGFDVGSAPCLLS